MKVGLLTDSDAFAGTERHMLDLGAELRTLGLDVALICPAAGPLAKRGAEEGLEAVALEKRAAFDPAAIWQIRQWFAAGRFDVIHAHNGRTALHAALARRFTSRGRLVATQHFLSPARASRRGLAGALGRALHRFAGCRIDRLIAISQATADAMLARAEADPGQVQVVLNGIRDPATNNLQPAGIVRAQWSVPPDDPLVVCLARLDREKGVETLIDAMGKVRVQLPAARCIVAGEGALMGELKARIGDSPAVTLAGFLRDPLSLVNAADVFVLPSPAEPFGLAIVEAMALEKPVIACRSGGPLEILRNPAAGKLVAPRDADALAAAVVAFLSNLDSARAVGLAARQEFVERFTARRMAREIAGVYEAVAR